MKEYEKLSSEQIKELDQSRKTNKKGKYVESRNTAKLDEQKISSIVTQEFKASLANISMAEAKEKEETSLQATKTGGAFKIVRVEAATAIPELEESGKLVSPVQPAKQKRQTIQSVLRKIRK